MASMASMSTSTHTTTTTITSTRSISEPYHHNRDNFFVQSFAALETIATPQVIIGSLLLAFTIPFLLHYLAYRAKPIQSPTFLIAGPQDAGKTSFLTYLQTGSVSPTQSSIVSSTSKIDLSSPRAPNSTKTTTITTTTTTTLNNEDDDNSLSSSSSFVTLTDTPGHPKLRSSTLDTISTTTTPLTGIIFLLDSSSPTQIDTIDYLYHTLLTLQTRVLASTGSSRAAASESNAVPVLIACNKSDLFTALPAGKISRLLETELEKLRVSKARGIVDVAEGEGGGDGVGEILGDDEGREFSWELLQEAGVRVIVKSGAVKEGKVKDWVEWMEEACL